MVSRNNVGQRQLLQFRHSHFSEKVRWALDHKGLEYEKVSLTRGPHIRQVRKVAPEPTVPVLIEPNGKVIQDSTAIIDHLESAYPNAPTLGGTTPEEAAEARRLEEYLDDKIGHHGRRFAYANLIDKPDALRHVVLQGKGFFAQLMFPLVSRLMRPRMIRRLDLGPNASAESEAEILKALDVIDKHLGDDNYLVGGCFTRADLTGAALLAIMTWPPEHEFDFPPKSMLPTRIQSFLDRIGDRPSYRWALRMYQQHRRVSSSAARPA